MTSSLVGSEMCIRDSSISVSRGVPHKRPSSGGRRRHGEVRQYEPFKLPVSYTHLTLPTICSV
eukprot:6816504-Prorocentrum_lima.AAC.1